MKHLQDKVQAILHTYPETRNSDTELTIQYWKQYYPQRIQDGKIKLESLFDLPQQDALGRVRRKIQEKDLYLPTDPQVAKRRWIYREEVKMWAIDSKWPSYK